MRASQRLARAVRRRQADDQSTRTWRGTIVAIDTTKGSLTCRVQGALLTGVRWIKTYTPVVGHDVIGIADGPAWVVTGQVSASTATTTTTYGNLAVSPTAAWQHRVGAHTGGHWENAPGGSLTQGRIVADDDTYRWAGLWLWDRLASLLPAGATVRAVKVRLQRDPSSLGDMLESPVLYQHAVTVIPADTATPGSLVTGTSWVPGGLVRGQLCSWDLPAAWITALVAGSTRGLAVVSDRPDEAATFGAASLHVAYSVTS